MKRIIKFFVFVFFMIQVVTVNAADITIDNVVDAFQNGALSEQYKAVNGVFEVTHDSDSVDIKIAANGETSNISFNLNGNIISADITNDDSTNDDFVAMYMFLSLMDEVGVLHGYEAGEISTALNSGLMDDYKLDTHGYEEEKISDDRSIYKFDFTKKIELPSYDNVYITVSDLAADKECILDESCSFYKFKGNIYITKTYPLGFVICEKGELTANTYNTSVSAVEVLFDDENVVNYYKNNYPSLSGDKSFDGFVIKTDSTKFTEEDLDALPYDPNNTLEGYVCSVIHVDTELAKESATKEPKPEEEPTKPDSEKEEEKKDEDNNLVLYIAIAAGALVAVGIVVFIIVNGKKNKNNNNTPQAPVMPQANINNVNDNQMTVQPVQPVTQMPQPPVDVIAPVVTDNVMVDVQNKQSQETSTNAAETKVEETNSVVEDVCPTCGEKKVGKFCMKCGYKF